MLRTVVGYAGGTKEFPTYRSLGDHTEAIQIEFDPAVTSYGELLDVFFAGHDPCQEAWSRQYQAILFWHDDVQRETAEIRARGIADSRGRPVRTELRAYERFWPAEDYHQKYYLRGKQALAASIRARFDSEEAFVHSPVVARVNAHLGGHYPLSALRGDLAEIGLRALGERRLDGVEPLATAAESGR